MTPTLYDATEREFTSNGLGQLTELYDVDIEEQRNGLLEFTGYYPSNGRRFENLQKDAIILAQPNPRDDPHAFRIVSTELDITGEELQIIADSITNDEAGNLITELTISDATGQDAMTAIQNASVEDMGFEYYSDIETKSSTKLQYVNALEAVAGTSGSLLQLWGGELKRENNKISLFARRGFDGVTSFRLGKNIDGLKYSVDWSGLVTQIYPYFKVAATSATETSKAIEEHFVAGEVVTSKHFTDYSHAFIQPIDASQEITVRENASDDEIKKLIDTWAANWFTQSSHTAIDLPAVSLDLDLLSLDGSGDYAGVLADLEKIGLCDSVTVYVPEFGVDVTAVINELHFDPMTKRVTSFKAGTARQSFADANKNELQQVQSQLIAVQSQMDYVATSANGKNANFYGNNQPVGGKEGDLWYFKDVNGEGIKQLQNGVWTTIVDSKFSEQVKNDIDAKMVELNATMADNQTKLDENAKIVAQVKTDTTAAVQSVNDAVAQAQVDTADAVKQANEAMAQALATNVVALDTSKIVEDVQKQTQEVQEQTQEVQKQLDDAKAKVDELQLDATNALNEATAAKDSAAAVLKLAGDTDKTVSSLVTKVDDAAASIESLATKTDVDGINKSVNTIDTQVKQNTAEIKLKATSTSVQALQDTVDKKSSELKLASDKIASQVTDVQKSNNETTARVSTLEQTAEGFKTTVSAVENLQVGGRNFFPHADTFEGWSLSSFWTKDSSTFDGQSVLKGNQSVGDAGHGFQCDVSCVSSDVIVSFYARTDATGTVKIHSEPNGVSGGTGGTDFTLSTTWTRYSYKAHIGNSQTLYWWALTTGVNIYFSEPQVEIGTIPTAWKVSPEDVSDRFSKVEQTANSVSSTVAAMNEKGPLQNRVSTVEQTADGLKTTVGNIRQAGKNLIYNGDAELGLDGWTSNSINNVYLSTHPYWYNGKKNFITLRPRGTGTNDETLLYSLKAIPVKQNTTYHLHFHWIAPVNFSSIDVLQGQTVADYLTQGWKPAGDNGVYDKDFNTGNRDSVVIRIDLNGANDGKSTWLGLSEISLTEGAGVVPYTSSSDNSADSVTFSQLSQTVDGFNTTVSNLQADVKPIQWQTVSTPNADLNTYTTSGKYFFNITTIKNGPGTGWAYVIVEAQSATRIIQTYQADNSNASQFQRILQNSTWTDWKRIANNGDIKSLQDADDNINKSVSEIRQTSDKIKLSVSSVETTANSAKSSIDGLQVGGANLLSLNNISMNSALTSQKFDYSDGSFQGTIPAGAGTSTFGIGISLTGDGSSTGAILPYGKTATFAVDVMVSKDTTGVIDINNAPVYGTAWHGNDNDSVRLPAITPTFDLKANVWTTMWYTITNADSRNTSFVSLYDGSAIGVKNTTSGSITAIFRHPRWVLGNVIPEWTPCQDDVKVGGVNLLPNTDSFSDWALAYGATKDSSSPAVVHYPKKASSGTSDDFLFYDQVASLKPDTDYVLSFTARGSGNLTTYVYPNVGTVDTDNNQTWTLTGADKRYVKKFHTLSNISDKKKLLFRNNGTTLEAWISQVKLEAGTVATEWSQAPEDTITRISLIEQNAEGIKTTVSAMNEKGPLQNRVSTVEQTADGLKTYVGSNINPNLVTNSGYPTIMNGYGWTYIGNVVIAKHYFYRNGKANLFQVNNTSTTAETYLGTNRFPVTPGNKYTVSFLGFAASNVKNMDVFFLSRPSGSGDDFTRVTQMIASRVLSPTKAEYVTATFTAPDGVDEGFLRFDNNSSTDGRNAALFLAEIKCEYGEIATPWSKDAADTLVTQTANNWSVFAQNNGLITGISVDANGVIDMNAAKALIQGGQLHITSATSIDNAVITSAKIASLDAAKITTGSLSADRIASTAINANNITSGTINAARIATTALNASNITAGELDVSKFKVKNLSAAMITTGTIAAERIAGTAINAKNITTGTIVGANLSINLNTGQVTFQKGRIHSSDNAIDVNIDQKYLSVADVQSRILLKGGEMQFIQPTYYDQQTSPYMKITNNLINLDNGFHGASVQGRDYISLTVEGHNDPTAFSGLGFDTFAGIRVSNNDTSGLATIIGGGKKGTVISGGGYSKFAMTNRQAMIRIGYSQAAESKGNPQYYGGNEISIDAENVYVYSAYAKTSSDTANLVVGSDGRLMRSTSASKYKADIERTQSPDMAKALLTLPIAHWRDKAEMARFANGEQITPPKRSFGMIAEDLASAGLEELVVRGDDGQLEGISYDRIAPALIPLLAEMQHRIDELERNQKS